METSSKEDQDADAISRQEIIAKLKELAQRQKKNSVSKSEFIRETGISEWQITKHFNNWNDCVREAELQPIDVSRIDDDTLFKAMRDAFNDAGGIVTTAIFRRKCRHSITNYKRRWGRWDAVLLEFRKWIETNDPTFPHLSDLPKSLSPSKEEATAPSASESPQGTGAVPARQPSFGQWKSTGGRQYGAFLNFRGLQHAPVNEQGVVFLFGMVALELGFVVESVATGFPDCESKRRVSKIQDKWERVRIEFEYQSRNFLEHGHKCENCDLIVCWEDNWQDCPIEVLELRAAIESLEP